MDTYYTYILTNFRKTVLYVGVTQNIQKRIIEHKQGIGSHFTKKYNVHMLVHVETYDSIKDAISREKQLKSGSRVKKELLINKNNPKWEDLYKQWIEDMK
ncbi:GIY-YIG nuclease family protein [Patescibacteria group bacterium]|nr:GIY-YIG nuclease family protein [Patescibacteria group bacterium]MBU1721860.1 GIY-YIG nuclease family protein [Patescibacteria group bacterium]MBU1901318.1 GIY-YIG nuclease family protein [Patescibacteria group bacterium]